MTVAGAATGLALEAVTIRLEGEELVSLDVSVRPGEVLTLMGPSGVGKSTLLAFIGGFLGRDFRASGRIVLNGRDVTALPPERRGIGLLFQDALLLPHLSVAGNLLIGLDPAVKGRASAPAGGRGGARRGRPSGFCRPRPRHVVRRPGGARRADAHASRAPAGAHPRRAVLAP